MRRPSTRLGGAPRTIGPLPVRPASNPPAAGASYAPSTLFRETPSRRAGPHPGRGRAPAVPGPSKGRTAIGLELEGTTEQAMKTLGAKGVKFEGIIDEGKAGRFTHFHDPDGNLLYLAELNWGHVNQ